MSSLAFPGHLDGGVHLPCDVHPLLHRHGLQLHLWILGNETAGLNFWICLNFLQGEQEVLQEHFWNRFQKCSWHNNGFHFYSSVAERYSIFWPYLEELTIFVRKLKMFEIFVLIYFIHLDIFVKVPDSWKAAGATAGNFDNQCPKVKIVSF